MPHLEVLSRPTTWRPREAHEFMPDAALRLPVPNLLAGRVLATLGSIALLIVWVWALVVANQAALRLEARPVEPVAVDDAFGVAVLLARALVHVGLRHDARRAAQGGAGRRGQRGRRW